MELTLTKNFYVWARGVLLQAGSNTSVQSSSTGVQTASSVYMPGLKSTDNFVYNTTYGIQGGSSLFCFKDNNTASDSCATTCIWASDGTTAPTVNDYNLAHSLPSISGTNTAFVQTETGFTLSCGITNLSDASINIQEIGLLKAAKTSSSGTIKYFLLARGVLDNAVAIPAGESKTFDVTVSLPTPTAATV